MYYKKTPTDLLEDPTIHFDVSKKDGLPFTKCHHCPKELVSKNAVTHMKDHIASHTGINMINPLAAHYSCYCLLCQPSRLIDSFRSGCVCLLVYAFMAEPFNIQTPNLVQGCTSTMYDGQGQRSRSPGWKMQFLGTYWFVWPHTEFWPVAWCHGVTTLCDATKWCHSPCDVTA